MASCYFQVTLNPLPASNQQVISKAKGKLLTGPGHRLPYWLA